LARRLLSAYPTLRFQKIQVYTKRRALPCGNLSQTPEFESFSFGTSIVETCYQLSSRKADAQSVINWTVVVDNTSELRRQTTVVYHSDRQALSTARYSRSGQLATADACRHCQLQRQSRSYVMERCPSVCLSLPAWARRSKPLGTGCTLL